MNKSLGVMLCCLLSGCGPTFFLDDIARSVKCKGGPDVSQDNLYPYQDTAPLPWVSVLPSQRAAQMKEVNFETIALQVRHDMKFPPFNHKFNNVQLILIDYGIEQNSPKRVDSRVMKEKGVAYSENYIKTEPQYVLNASFYTFDNRPPNPPCFEEKITLSASRAAPSEAIKMMAHEVILDHLASSLKKITVDLD